MKRICVYAASNPGVHPDYEKAALQLGDALVSKQYELVYGGASVGLMGRVANQVLDNGGRAIGVMPRGLFRREIAHSNLTEFHEVESMHERKAMMASLSDAFVALPGGLGTFEELFEAACWSQIGIHQKPIGLLNIRGFYNPLMEFLEHTVREGFMRESSMGIFIVESDPVTLLNRLAEFAPVEHGNKWTELTPDK